MVAEEIKPKTQDAQSLDAWIKRLSEREMPIFANTAHAVAGLATNRQTSASELTQVVLRDASMTARVLRMANSSYYNPGRRNISTVSRAVVVLGLNALRSICMSTAVVDTLLKGIHKERVAREMARSFHAAVQARDLAVKSKAGQPEDDCQGPGTDAGAVSEMVQANAKEAAKTAVAFGAVTASRLIPLRPAEEGKPAAAQPAPEPAFEIGKAPEPEYHEPDPALQLRILRELSTMLNEQPDLNLLVSMVMEGIFRGVGMDRAVFALLTPDRRWLKAKYALGCSSCRTEDMRQGFAFEIDPGKPSLFGHVLDTRQPLWARREPGEPLAKLLTPEIRALTRDGPFFVIPLVMDRQVIGLIYGDRQPSGRDLDEESFSSFNHFCQQAILGLTYYGQRGG